VLAILCASMSTATGAILATSTVMAHNIFRKVCYIAGLNSACAELCCVLGIQHLALCVGGVGEGGGDTACEWGKGGTLCVSRGESGRGGRRGTVCMGRGRETLCVSGGRDTGREGGGRCSWRLYC
jgi:hypothetical protein